MLCYINAWTTFSIKHVNRKLQISCMRAWTLLVIKTRQLLSERESQSAMIICRVCARRFFQFPVMFTNNKKWRSTSWLTMLNSLFSFPTFLPFSPFRLVRSNTWIQWKHLTPERSIDLCLQTFPKLLLLLVPKVTTRSLYPECKCYFEASNWRVLSRKSFRR
jgi:hypothetical protein